MRFGRVGKLGWKERGGVGRDLDVLMELHVSKVTLNHHFNVIHLNFNCYTLLHIIPVHCFEVLRVIIEDTLF